MSMSLLRLALSSRHCQIWRKPFPVFGSPSCRVVSWYRTFTKWGVKVKITLIKIFSQSILGQFLVFSHFGQNYVSYSYLNSYSPPLGGALSWNDVTEEIEVGLFGLFEAFGEEAGFFFLGVCFFCFLRLCGTGVDTTWNCWKTLLCSLGADTFWSAVTKFGTAWGADTAAMFRSGLVVLNRSGHLLNFLD